MDDRLALSARQARRRRRVGHDLDFADRNHAGGLCADRDVGGPVGFSGGIRRYHRRCECPCHSLPHSAHRRGWPADAHPARLSGNGRARAPSRRRDPCGPAGQGAGHGHGQGPQRGCRSLRHRRGRPDRDPAHRRHGNRHRQYRGFRHGDRHRVRRGAGAGRGAGRQYRPDLSQRGQDAVRGEPAGQELPGHLYLYRRAL